MQAVGVGQDTADKPPCGGPARMGVGSIDHPEAARAGPGATPAAAEVKSARARAAKTLSRRNRPTAMHGAADAHEPSRNPPLIGTPAFALDITTTPNQTRRLARRSPPPTSGGTLPPRVGKDNSCHRELNRMGMLGLQVGRGFN